MASIQRDRLGSVGATSIELGLNRLLEMHVQLLLAVFALVLIALFAVSGSAYLPAAMIVVLSSATLAYYVCAFETVDTVKSPPAFPDDYHVFEVHPGRCYSILFQTPPQGCGMAPGETWTGNMLAGSTILASLFGKVFILKADDLGNPVSLPFRRCIDIIYRNKAKIGLGVITRDFSPRKEDRIIRVFDRLRRVLLAVLTLGRKGDVRLLTWRGDYLRGLNAYNFEFYCHGWDHFGDTEANVFEFQNSGYTYQYQHLKLAKSALEHLGLSTRVFGAPFLRTDSDTAKALINNGFKVLLTPTTQSEGEDNAELLRMPIRLWFEDWGTRIPQRRGHPRPLAEIVEAYDQQADCEFLVGHMHPDRWSEHWDSFDSLVAYISTTRQFFNPEEYFRLLADRPHFQLTRISPTDYILDLADCRYRHYLRIRKSSSDEIIVEECAAHAQRGT